MPRIPCPDCASFDATGEVCDLLGDPQRPLALLADPTLPCQVMSYARDLLRREARKRPSLRSVEDLVADFVARRFGALASNRAHRTLTSLKSALRTAARNFAVDEVRREIGRYWCRDCQHWDNVGNVRKQPDDARADRLVPDEEIGRAATVWNRKYLYAGECRCEAWEDAAPNPFHGRWTLSRDKGCRGFRSVRLPPR